MPERAARARNAIQWCAGLAVFALVCYRALTRAVWIDEAFTWNVFVSLPFREAFALYDANNHLLFTLLARASTALLPPSELPLRLPSLLGAALFLWALALLVNRLTPTLPLQVISYALIAVHPAVLEYLHSARGYSLALGLWTLAAAMVARALDEGPVSRSAALATGALLGLAFSANATYVIPAAALWLGLVLSRARQWDRPALMESLAIASGAVLAALPAALYHALKATGDKFYYGADAFNYFLTEIYRSGIVFAGITESWLGHAPLAYATAHGWWLALLLIAAGFAAAVAMWRAGQGSAAILAFTLAFSVAAVVALHRLWNVPYPLERTALYFIPLSLLVVMQGLGWMLRRNWLTRAAALPGLALGVVLFAQCLSFLPLDYQSQSRFDAGNRALMERIAREIPPGQPRTLGGNWLLCEGMNYYRAVLRVSSLAPMQRTGPDGDFDFYVLLDEDLPVARKRNLRIIYTHPVAHSHLAVPPR